MGDANSAHLWN